MRTKVTLVLLFLNVALFFFIFKFERSWRTEDSWKEARRRVLGAEATDIRSLEISRSEKTSGEKTVIALAKRADGWFITKPIEWPANPAAVNRILNDLQLLEHETSFYVRDLAKNGQSLADYGLEKPKLRVSFTTGEPGLENTRPPPSCRWARRPRTTGGCICFLLTASASTSLIRASPTVWR